MGRPCLRDGLRARLFIGRPCDWPGCAASAYPSVSFAHRFSRRSIDAREAEVRCGRVGRPPRFLRGRDRSIRAGGRARAGSRPTPEELELFAPSLAPDDQVALEVTGNAWEIARILEPHVPRVVVVSPSDTGDPSGAGQDRSPRRARAGQAAGRRVLDAVWMPDERDPRDAPPPGARAAQLVRARSRAKNEIHAVLVRRLKGRPPASDLFGKQRPGVAGRARVAGRRARDRRRRPAPHRLPRRRDRRGRARIALQALHGPRSRRLMTVPGRQPDRRRHLHGGGRRHPPLPRAPASSSATSASTPGSASPASAPPATAASPSKAPRHVRHALVEAAGARSASPARCAPSTSASAPAAATRSRSSPPPASSPACSGACSPAAGLRLRPTLTDQEEAPPPRDHRRRPQGPRHHRDLIGVDPFRGHLTACAVRARKDGVQRAQDPTRVPARSSAARRCRCCVPAARRASSPRASACREQTLRNWRRQDQARSPRARRRPDQRRARGAAPAAARERAAEAGARSAQTSRGLLRSGDRDPVTRLPVDLGGEGPHPGLHGLPAARRQPLGLLRVGRAARRRPRAHRRVADRADPRDPRRATAASTARRASTPSCAWRTASASAASAWSG